MVRIFFAQKRESPGNVSRKRKLVTWISGRLREFFSDHSKAEIIDDFLIDFQLWKKRLLYITKRRKGHH